MKITCDHCGSLVDTDKDKCCPTCGAALGETKDYKEFKEYRQKNRDYDLKEREINIHNKEMASQMIEKGMKVRGGLLLFSTLFIALTIGIMIILIGRGFFSNIKNTKNTNKYEISCNEVKIAGETIFSSFDKKDENSEYYMFHIVFKNLDGKYRSLTNINVTYTDNNGNEDVVAKKPIFSNMNNTLESFANEKVTYTGYLTYEIPNYVEDVNLVFEEVKVEIKDFKSLIKE